MMGSSGIEYFLILLLTELSFCLEPRGSKQPPLSWVRPGILTHQSLHSVLVSMEERLRGLENMKYTTNRLDLYLDTFTRQLDSLDVRTRAVQIKLEQLETVAQNLVSHELKNDLSTVHLQRKFETNQDRLIHKISLTENRLDSSITKLQGTVDLGFEKFDKKQNEFHNKFNNLGNMLEGVSQRMNKIEEYTNTTTHALQQNKISDFEDSRNSHLNKITDMLEGIENHVSKSIMLSEQNASPKNLPRDDDKIKEIMRTEIHSEANKIGNKINNMYNDVWGKVVIIENLIKNVSSTSNEECTKMQLQNNATTTADDIRCSETIESVMGGVMGTLGGFLQRKLERMDSNLEGVFASHKMLLGAYNKMREDKNQFENKLTFVLGKILDTIENRTKTVDELQREILEELKSHFRQVVRTVAYNTNSLMKLSEDSGVEHKSLDNSLIQLLSYATRDKHESQEYEDNLNDSFHKGKQNEEKEIKVENVPDTISDHRIKENKRDEVGIDSKVDANATKPDTRRNFHSKVFSEKDKTQIVTNQEENSTSENDDRNPHEKIHTFTNFEGENDKAVTRLLMLYLKALKGHLSKEKFLYEANPPHPYSSVQEMIKSLKEKNFPSDFLRELDEWDNETNDKEANEDIIDLKEFTDNPSEDYYIDNYENDSNKQ